MTDIISQSKQQIYRIRDLKGLKYNLEATTSYKDDQYNLKIDSKPQNGASVKRPDQV